MNLRRPLIIIAAALAATLAGCGALRFATGTETQQEAAARDVVTELREAGAELRGIAEQTRAQAQTAREAAEAAGDTQQAAAAAQTEQQAAKVRDTLDKAATIIVAHPQGPAGIDPGATIANVGTAIGGPFAVWAPLAGTIVTLLWGLSQRRAARVIVNSIDAQRADPTHGPALREAMQNTKTAARKELQRSKTARDLLESERLT